MIGKLKSVLQGMLAEVRVDDEEHSLKLACAILMFEVLRADMHTDESEVSTICRHVMRAFSLDEHETRQLMEKALQESVDAVSLHGVLRIINDEYQPQEKRELIRVLWDVAYADGELNPYEEYMIRKLADWLYVPHRDFMQTKHEAAEN